jgi:hypothetical protein
MPLNHSKSTATVTVAGLALIRMIPHGDTKQCEVGILQCANHTLELLIEEITMEADGLTPKCSRVIEPAFHLDRDIFIGANHPVTDGVSAYKPDRPKRQPSQQSFTRDQKLDDIEDYRWVVDFTSPDFNNGPIEPVPDRATTSSPKTFKPKIYFTNGTLYTAAITPDHFARELLPERSDHRFVGQIGFRVGLDITCGNGDNSGIELSNHSGKPQFLPKAPYGKNAAVRYQISIENICPFTADTLAGGTDFRFYYDAITTSDHNRFDLRRVVPNGGDRNKQLATHAEFSLDGLPLACNPGGDG